MENYKFVFKHNKSVGHYICGSLMVIFGVLWIQYFLFGAVVLGIGSVIIIAFQEGVEIDLENKKYRNALFIGDYPMGNWKDLPEIKYISVFKTIIVSGVTGRSGASVTSREKVILINLIHGKNQQITVYKTEVKEDAFEKAEFLATKLNLRIYDATERVGEWHT